MWPEAVEKAPVPSIILNHGVSITLSTHTSSLNPNDDVAFVGGSLQGERESIMLV